jgi:hypothetical protein
MPIEKKNITLAFDIKEYQEFEAIKEKLGLKSFTRLVQFFKNFYEENVEYVEEIKSSEVEIVKDIHDIKSTHEKVMNFVKKHESEIEMMKDSTSLLIQNSKFYSAEINELKEIIAKLVDNSLLADDVDVEISQLESLKKARKNLKT